MTGFRHGLPVALIPEQVMVATMGHPVVDDISQLAAAADAEGMRGEESGAGLAPASAVESTACVEAAVLYLLRAGMVGAIALRDAIGAPRGRTHAPWGIRHGGEVGVCPWPQDSATVCGDTACVLLCPLYRLYRLVWYVEQAGGHVM